MEGTAVVDEEKLKVVVVLAQNSRGFLLEKEEEVDWVEAAELVEELELAKVEEERVAQNKTGV